MDNLESVCAAVLGLLEEAFDASDDKMGQRLVAVGGVLVDGCCDGLLAVAPEQRFRSSWSEFPLPLDDEDECLDPVTAVSLLVLAQRCLVPVDNRGRAPSMRVQGPVYSMVLRDAQTVWRVLSGVTVLGVDTIGDPLWQRASLNQMFTANDGGCLGTETRVTFGVPGELCE